MSHRNHTKQNKSITHPCFRRAGGVAQGKLFDLFDVDMVVETNEVPSLLLLLLWHCAGCAGGCRGSTAGLGNRQCATGAHRHGTAVTAHCCCGREAKCTFNLKSSFSKDEQLCLVECVDQNDKFKYFTQI